MLLSFSDNPVLEYFQSERGGNDAYVDYDGMHGVQEQKLSDEQEQEERSRSSGAEEVLPALQKRNFT